MKERMRSIKGVVIVAALLLIGAGCAGTLSNDATQQGGEPKVAATIFPIYDLVRSVAGEDVDVELITPPGSSPHYFDATPSLIRRLQGTSRVFVVGAGLDTWAEKITDSINAQTVDLSKAVSLRESDHGDDHEEHEQEDEHGHDDHEDDHEEHEEDAHDHGHAHGSIDPHYWLDPSNAVSIIDTAVRELSIVSPEDKVAFESRAANMKDILQKRDAQWKRETRQLRDKNIVTFHDAFGYFADHFGLTVLATFEPFAGKDPSPRYLQELQTEIEEHGITTMFLEPQLSADALQTFAKDNNITLGVLDPLGGIDDRKSYVDLIDYNVKTVVQSLR